ncbi:uncharacterized protein LOC128034820 [Gossypium raimondii]|uniref:uncharacterized protein LOC128034820 n=1 Tax=Gossypium raimondii TaxID=29730 RepID=UPI00227A8433|nr:uncharacterized protein LOC128034820 [Gossypium raimondii]
MDVQLMLEFLFFNLVGEDFEIKPWIWKKHWKQDSRCNGKRIWKPAGSAMLPVEAVVLTIQTIKQSATARQDLRVHQILTNAINPISHHLQHIPKNNNNTKGGSKSKLKLAPILTGLTVAGIVLVFSVCFIVLRFKGKSLSKINDDARIEVAGGEGRGRPYLRPAAENRGG